MYRVPNAIHDELLNWARWCNLGAWPHPLPRTQCGSLEGDYRPPAWEALDDEEPPPPKPIRPNERHARRVQEAWESLEGFPRLVLKSEYPGFEGRRGDRAERLRLTIQQYENHLQIAVNRVESAFHAARA
ncbi:hypothetical protein [Variovorax saccharolyticus]|uniref:hypothetical protein n=1 Tax=Variovorax saccharolyticus TaxID=3053516 RepID=UPI002575C1D0|nr:hypothetical protein [Variovorax sp. J31P216]MDM0024093.1 hypothetical protein [Variovorax sp. J31P216]